MGGTCRALMIPGSIAAPVALWSCTMTWVRPNTSPEQVKQDSAGCRIAAYGKYPERMVHVESDNRREPSRDEDTNTLLRDEEAKYCMRQRGYPFEHARGGA